MDAGIEEGDLRAFPFIRRYPSSRRRRTVGDRFIPVRSETDFAFVRGMLTGGGREGENDIAASPSAIAYRKRLAEALGMNRTRMLVFKQKSPIQTRFGIQESSFLRDSCHTVQSLKPQRCIPQKPEKILNAPDIVDDESLNVLDWSSTNIVAIALWNTVLLRDASNGVISELMTVDDEDGPVTSVSWAPDGQTIAIGLNNSDVQLWDVSANRKLRTLQWLHESRVGSLTWNEHILTTGGMDGFIYNNDVRMRSLIVDTYLGHRDEISGLKWSHSGRQLASGGKDNLMLIWDQSMASSNSSHRWLHRFDHHASVKALAWCPFQSNLLASGGGGRHGGIKFWKTNTGSLLRSVDTGSEVWSLIWSKNEKELLSSHGSPENQLNLWKYPSMTKMADLTGHTSRVLFMAQSPDGCTVASASGDESLRFWNVFGTPQRAKPTTKTTYACPFSNALSKWENNYPNLKRELQCLMPQESVSTGECIKLILFINNILPMEKKMMAETIKADRILFFLPPRKLISYDPATCFKL